MSALAQELIERGDNLNGVVVHVDQGLYDDLLIRPKKPLNATCGMS